MNKAKAFLASIFLISLLIFFFFVCGPNTSSNDISLTFPELNVIQMCDGSYCFPRIVWSYWDSDLPEDVAEMIDVSRKSLINFTHIFLTNRNLSTFINLTSFPKNFSKLGVANKADYIRLCLIEKYGGVWVDASTYINSGKDMEWVFLSAFNGRAQLVGFGNLDMPPAMSTSFFGAPAKSEIMRLWREEFGKSIDYGAREYLKQLCPKMPQTNDCYNEYFCTDSITQLFLRNPEMNKAVVLLPWQRYHNRLFDECEHDVKCFRMRMLHDPSVRNYPFIKVEHLNRNGKRFHFQPHEHMEKRKDYSGIHYKVMQE